MDDILGVRLAKEGVDDILGVLSTADKGVDDIGVHLLLITVKQSICYLLTIA